MLWFIASIHVGTINFNKKVNNPCTFIVFQHQATNINITQFLFFYWVISDLLFIHFCLLPFSKFQVNVKKLQITIAKKNCQD